MWTNKQLEVIVEICMTADNGCEHCVMRCFEQFFALTSWDLLDKVINILEHKSIEDYLYGEEILKKLKECQGNQ